VCVCVFDGPQPLTAAVGVSQRKSYTVRVGFVSRIGVKKGEKGSKKEIVRHFPQIFLPSPRRDPKGEDGLEKRPVPTVRSDNNSNTLRGRGSRPRSLAPDRVADEGAHRLGVLDVALAVGAAPHGHALPVLAPGARRTSG